MPIDVTITLSDEGLERFQQSIDKGKLALESKEAALWRPRLEDACPVVIL